MTASAVLQFINEPLPAIAAPELRSAGRPANIGELVENFSRIQRQYEGAMMRVRTKIIEREARIVALFQEATEFGPDFVLAIRSGLQSVIEQVSIAASNALRNTADIALADDEQEALQKLPTPLRRKVRRAERDMKRITLQWHEWLVDVYYRLLALDAEHDPESYDGQGFEDADDLIASLG